MYSLLRLHVRMFFFMCLLKVPQSTYRAPVEEDVIAKVREENRKRAEVSVWHTNSLYCLHTHSVCVTLLWRIKWSTLLWTFYMYNCTVYVEELTVFEQHNNLFSPLIYSIIKCLLCCWQEELIRSSARQPACASAEKSDKAKRRMRKIIDEENSKWVACKISRSITCIWLNVILRTSLLPFMQFERYNWF